MKNWNISLSLSILFMLLSLVPQAAIAQTYLKLGHTMGIEHPHHLGLLKFSELVAEKSQGKINIEVFPQGQLGNELHQVQDLQLGALDMTLAASGTLSGLTDAFMIFNLPYIFPDYEAAFKVLDGPTGDKIFASIKSIHLVGLAYMEGGMRHISTHNKPVESPKDMLGLHLRTMVNKINVAAFKKVKALPTPMSFSELLTAVDTCGVDAMEGPLALLYTTELGKRHQHITLTGHLLSPSPIFMSLQSWEKLNSKERNIIKQAAMEAKDFQRAEIIRLENEYLEKIAPENGINVIKADRDEWKNIMESVYDEFHAEINQEILSEIIQAVKIYEQERGNIRDGR